MLIRRWSIAAGVVLSLCTSGRAQDTTATAGAVTDYFPLAVGSRWEYPTGGYENSGFTITVQHNKGNRWQVGHVDQGALASRVYEVTPDEIKLVYAHEEHTTDPASLDAEPNHDDIYLKGPVAEGTAWTSSGTNNVIRRVGARIRVHGKDYADVIEVVRTPEDGHSNSATYDYFAKGVGLVRSRFEADGFVNEAELGTYEPGK